MLVVRCLDKVKHCRLISYSSLVSIYVILSYIHEYNIYSIYLVCLWLRALISYTGVIFVILEDSNGLQFAAMWMLIWCLM